MLTIRVFAATLAVALALSGGPAPAAEKPAGAPAANGKPIRALLVCGGCCHDYKAQQEILKQGISARANVQWTVAYSPGEEKDKLNPIFEKENWADGFDVIIHDECTSGVTDPAVVERILKPHKAGLPAVVLHCGMHSFRMEGWETKPTPWMEFLGVHSIKHGPKEPIAVKFVEGDAKATDSPAAIVQGLKGWETGPEELYNNVGDKILPTATALAKGDQKVKDGIASSTVVWTNQYAGKTKVFGTTLGHYNQTVADARYLNLVTRGMLWSLGRLDEFMASDESIDLAPFGGPDAVTPPAKGAPKKKKKQSAAAGSELLQEVKTPAVECCGGGEQF